MPDSQENELTGDINAQIRFIQDSTSCDQLIARFQRITDSFRRIGPAAVETADTIRQLTPLVEEPMINLRQGDYPRWDNYNTYWFSPYAIYDFNGGSCFICGADTNRMDIMLDKMFCDSSECNASLTTS